MGDQFCLRQTAPVGTDDGGEYHLGEERRQTGHWDGALEEDDVDIVVPVNICGKAEPMAHLYKPIAPVAGGGTGPQSGGSAGGRPVVATLIAVDPLEGEIGDKRDGVHVDEASERPGSSPDAELLGDECVDVAGILSGQAQLVEHLDRREGGCQAALPPSQGAGPVRVVAWDLCRGGSRAGADQI